MKKNNMICFFLGILIVFMLFISNKEGMTNDCMYQYLSPTQTNAPLDNQTINEFMTLYDSQMDQLGSKIKLTRAIYDAWINMKVWCTEEIQYYVKHKYFPINQYLLFELKTNKNIKLPPPFNHSTIAFGFSARMIYYQIIVPSYAGNPNLPRRVKEAQAIYIGAKPEPTCVSVEATNEVVDAAKDDHAFDPAPLSNVDGKTYACTKACNNDCTVDNNPYACTHACNNACNADSSFRY
jgi:hypothetical protein